MAEPLTIDQAKAHLEIVDDISRDALIADLITAAREYVEKETGHILVRRTLTRHFDGFSRFLELSHTPVVSITSVSYQDAAGATQTYAGAVYSLNRYPARIYPAINGWWPSLSRYGGVTVTYVAGYMPGEEPRALLQAMLLLLGTWFSQREAVSERGVQEVPFAVQSIISQYRMPGL